MPQPVVEGGDVGAIVTPRDGRRVAKKRIVVPRLATGRSQGPYHASGGKVVERVACHGRSAPCAHPPEPTYEIVVGADDILVRHDVAADVGGHRVGIVGPVCVVLVDGDAGRGECATHENIGAPRHAPDVVIERDIAFEIDVLDVRSVVGEAVKPKRPVVEDDVVLQQQRGGRALAVDPVRQVVGAAVVVHDGAVDFGPGGLRPDEDAVIRCVMDHQVDELRAGRVDVDAMQRLRRLRGGARNLEAPKPRVRTRHQEGSRHGGALAGKLAHHDRGVRCSRQLALEASRVGRVGIGPAAQPDRATRCDRGGAAQGRGQVPRVRERSVARRRPARRYEKVRGGGERVRGRRGCADVVLHTIDQQQRTPERQRHPKRLGAKQHRDLSGNGGMTGPVFCKLRARAGVLPGPECPTIQGACGLRGAQHVS